MGLFNFLFNKDKKPSLGKSIKESGNVFMMLFGAVGMVGVIGASTMTVMKGPVKTMSQVTKRTIAENNMIAAGKLSLIAASQQATSGDCDADGTVEPIPFATPLTGLTGGGTLPATIGVAKEDPWGNEYGYCTWDHGTEADANCGGSTNFRTGGAVADQYVLAIISAGPDRMFNTSCDDYVDSSTPILNKTGGSDDIIMGYTYAEAGAIAGGLWSDDAGSAAISRDLKVVDPTDPNPSPANTLNFSATSGDFSIAGAGQFPSVRTDNLQSIGAAINVLSPILGISDITTTGNLNGSNLDATGTLDVTGATTLAGLTAGATTLGTTGVSSLDAGSGAIITTGSLSAGATTLGATAVSSLSSGSTITAGGDVILGTNFLTGDGVGNDGLSIDAAGNVTTSNDLSVGGTFVPNSLAVTTSATIGTTLGVTGATTLAGLTAGATTLSSLDMGNGVITGVGAPGADATAAVNKSYVDSAVAAGAGYTETDPQVGDVSTAGKWCASDGDSIECTQNAPTVSEVDPQVGTLTAGKWCTTNGVDIDCTTDAPVMGGGGATDEIVDADGNTKIQVEEGADDNTIRFDTAGTERMIIDENGRIGIGSTPRLNGLLTIDAEGPNYIDIASYRDDLLGGGLLISHARGTKAAPLPLLNGDAGGSIYFNGYDGVDNLSLGLVTAYAEGDLSAGNVSGRLRLGTYNSTDPDPTRNQIILDSVGLVGMGVTNPKSKLHINGDLLLSNAATTCGADQKGAIRLNATGDGLDMCDGISAWSAFGNGGADNLGNHTATTALNLATNKITNLGTPTAVTDATTKGYVDTAVAAAADDLGNHTATTALIMGSNKITGLSDPTLAQDAATKSYVDTAIVAGADDLGNHTATTALIMGANKITGLADPTAAQDAATKAYVDTAVATGGSADEIVDANGNTKIQVEEGADDNTIRFDTAGVERMVISPTGNLGIGTTSPGVKLEVVDEGPVRIRSTRFSADENPARIEMLKGRGTQASPSAVQAGDIIGAFNYGAYATATVFDISAANISASVAGPPTATNVPTDLSFRTTNLTGTTAEKMRITAGGAVGIGDPDPDGTLKLDVEGQIGATEYCDEAGANCFDYADVSSGADTLAGLSCTDGQVAVWNNGGSAWICANNGSGAGDDLGNHTATTALDLATNKITNLGTPTANTDAATKLYVDTEIAGLTDNDTLAALTCTDGQIAKWNNGGSVWECAADDSGAGADDLGNHTATTALNLATNKITNLGTPTAAADATTKGYVDTAVAAAADNLGNHTATQGVIFLAVAGASAPTK